MDRCKNRRCSKSRVLEINDYYRLKGLHLSVTHIRPITPLLHSFDGGCRQGCVSFYQSNAINFSCLIDDFFEDDCALRL